MSATTSSGARVPFDVAKRRIDSSDIAFANANKHRMGWQTLARIRGVNVVDLKRAVERTMPADLPAEPASSVPVQAEHTRLSHAEMAMKVLRTVAAGAAGTLDISDACGISRGSASQHVYRLKLEGLMAGHGRSGWVLTNAGAEALRKAAP